MSQRPTYVDIGPHRFTILWDKATLDAYRAQIKDQDADGFIRFHRLEISVDPEAPLTFQQQIVLHEVLHGVIEQAGGVAHGKRRGDEDDHHDVIGTLECGLLDVLRRNPQVVAFLCAKDGEGS